mgnify:CR=1 FL=1
MTPEYTFKNYEAVSKADGERVNSEEKNMTITVTQHNSEGTLFLRGGGPREIVVDHIF